MSIIQLLTKIDILQCMKQILFQTNLNLMVRSEIVEGGASWK